MLSLEGKPGSSPGWFSVGFPPTGAVFVTVKPISQFAEAVPGAGAAGSRDCFHRVAGLGDVKARSGAVGAHRLLRSVATALTIEPALESMSAAFRSSAAERWAMQA